MAESSSFLIILKLNFRQKQCIYFPFYKHYTANCSNDSKLYIPHILHHISLQNKIKIAEERKIESNVLTINDGCKSPDVICQKRVTRIQKTTVTKDEPHVIQ